MCRGRLITVVGLVLASSGSVRATPLEYRIEGVARYREGSDTSLDGASLTILMGIDSEAEPFDGIPDEFAAYYFDEGSVWLTLVGSSGSDGSYAGSGEFVLALWDADSFMFDSLGIGGGPFVTPGTDAYAFGMHLDDYFAQALDSVAVPTSIDVEAFMTPSSYLNVMTGEGSIHRYSVDNLAITITVVPEPGSLGLLALGTIGLLRRRLLFPSGIEDEP